MDLSLTMRNSGLHFPIFHIEGLKSNYFFKYILFDQMDITIFVKDRLRMILAIVFSSIFLLLQPTNCEELQYTINQKYSYSGKIVIDIDHQVETAGTQNFWLNPLKIRIPYPGNFIYNQVNQVSKNSKLISAITLGDFSYKYFNFISILSMIEQTTQSYLQVKIMKFAPRQIFKISICYLLVLESNNNFRSLHVETQQMFHDFSDPSFETSFLLTYYIVELDTALKSVSFINGYNVSSPNNDILQLLVYTKVEEPNLLVKISCPTRSIRMYGMIFTVILYNEDLTSSQSLSLRLNIGLIIFSESDSTFYNTYQQIDPINTFIGLSGFKISSKNDFSFFTSINPYSISIKGDYFQYASFTFISITSKYCHYKQPYYEEVSQMCYSQCPGITTASNHTLSCRCFINNVQKNNQICFSQQGGSLISAKIIISLSIVVVLILLACIIKFRIRQRKNRADLLIQRENAEDRQIELAHQQSQLQSNQSENSSVWHNAQTVNSSRQLCSICLQGTTFFKTSCQHNFHFSCISKLGEIDIKCPYCRRRIQKYGRFYCTVCNARYQMIEISSSVTINKSLYYQCDKCRRIPI